MERRLEEERETQTDLHSQSLARSQVQLKSPTLAFLKSTEEEAPLQLSHTTKPSPPSPPSPPSLQSPSSLAE